MADKEIFHLDKLVQQAGYVDPKAQYMERILRCVVETLSYAEERLAQEWTGFCVKKGALRKPGKGKSSDRAYPDENALTYEIGDYVEDYIRHLPDDHEFRLIQFHYEKLKRSKKLAGSHRKRLDLRYEAHVASGPELVIEAKPLRQVADIDKRYLGEEGLGRFLREEEAYTHEKLGALLGYVAKDVHSAYQADIKQKTQALDGCELVVDVSLPPWPETYSSRHLRSDSRPSLWVLHFLLQFPSTVA